MGVKSSCSEAVQSILTNSRKDSTRKFYLVKWKCFLVWAQQKPVSCGYSPYSGQSSFSQNSWGPPGTNECVPPTFSWLFNFCSLTDYQILQRSNQSLSVSKEICSSVGLKPYSFRALLTSFWTTSPMFHFSSVHEGYIPDSHQLSQEGEQA